MDIVEKEKNSNNYQTNSFCKEGIFIDISADFYLKAAKEHLVNKEIKKGDMLFFKNVKPDERINEDDIVAYRTKGHRIALINSYLGCKDNEKTVEIFGKLVGYYREINFMEESNEEGNRNKTK